MVKRAAFLTFGVLVGLGWGIAPVHWYVALTAAAIMLTVWAAWRALARGDER